MKPQNDFIGLTAKMLRDQAKRNPTATTALSFLPGAGDVIDGAAIVDPTSTWAEKAEGAANLIPGMDLIKALRQRGPMMDIVGGSNARNPDLENAWLDDTEGVAGRLKFEIPDQDSFLKGGYDDLLKDGARSVDLSEILGHGELYDQYPELMKTQVKVRDTGNSGGYYHPLDQSITLANKELTPRQVKSILLHEVNHAIQDDPVEGFRNRGTNPESAGSFLKYMKDRGEVESRIVQHRADWNDAERKAVPFEAHLAAELRRLNYIPRAMAQKGYRSPAVIDYKINSEWTDVMQDPEAMARYLRRYNEQGPDPTRDRRIKPRK